MMKAFGVIFVVLIVNSSVLCQDIEPQWLETTTESTTTASTTTPEPTTTTESTTESIDPETTTLEEIEPVEQQTEPFPTTLGPQEPEITTTISSVVNPTTEDIRLLEEYGICTITKFESRPVYYVRFGDFFKLTTRCCYLCCQVRGTSKPVCKKIDSTYC